jgi:hypothetical protein
VEEKEEEEIRKEEEINKNYRQYYTETHIIHLDHNYL